MPGATAAPARRPRAPSPRPKSIVFSAPVGRVTYLHVVISRESSMRIMNRWYFLLILLLPVLAQGSLLGLKCSWEFMQSVGGLTIGSPERHDDATWSLPVNCNVSGLRAFTVKPAGANSGLVWADTIVEVGRNKIYITIEKGVGTLAGNSGVCGPAGLGSIKAGTYSVFYLSTDRSKHLLGTVDIGS